jgi:hypothetical protein
MEALNCATPPAFLQGIGEGVAPSANVNKLTAYIFNQRPSIAMFGLSYKVDWAYMFENTKRTPLCNDWVDMDVLYMSLCVDQLFTQAAAPFFTLTTNLVDECNCAVQ